MPQPAIQDVHVDRLLTHMSLAYMNEPSEYHAAEMFPEVPVNKQSDLYALYTKNDWFRDEAQLRAPGTESSGGGYNLDFTNSYLCQNWSFHKDIAEEIRKNADMPINMDLDATRFVTERLRLRKERLWTSKFFAAGIWATDKTPTKLWNDYADSNPHVDIEAGIDSIISVTGRKPNRFLMGRPVWTQLRHHPDIMDKIKYTQLGVLAEELLGVLIGIKKVKVGNAIYATNEEGATEAYSYIYGKHALLSHAADRPGLLTPSAGYTFVWKFLPSKTIFIRRIPMPLKTADRVEGHIYIDMKVTGADLGYFFEDVVA